MSLSRLFASLSRVWSRVRSVPVIRPADDREGGLACLLTVLHHHGCWRTMAECRAVCEDDGGDVAGMRIEEAARRLGLEVRSWVLPALMELRRRRLPAIAHWGKGRFVVIERVTWSRVRIVDPSSGRWSLTHEAFHQYFSGIVLILEPGAAFERCPRRSAAGWWWRLLVEAVGRKALVAMLGVTIACSLFLQVSTLLMPWLLYVAIDWIVPNQLWHPLSWLMAGAAFAALSRAALKQARSLVALRLRAAFEPWLTAKVVSKAMRLPFRRVQHQALEVRMRGCEDVSVLGDVLSARAIGIVIDGALAIVPFVVLWWWSYRFAWLALIVVLVEIAMLMSAIPLIRELVYRRAMMALQVRAGLADLLRAFASIKLAGTEAVAAGGWTERVREQAEVELRRDEIEAAFGSVRSGLLFLGQAMFLVAGTQLVMEGAISIGEMVALNALGVAVLAPIGALTVQIRRWPEMAMRFERVRNLIETEADVVGAKRLLEVTSDGLNIELDRVRFRYHGAESWAADDLTMSVRGRKVVVVVGRGGAGKSTLAGLLAGLYRAASGQITIDGVLLDDVEREEWRRRCAVVLPSDVLVEGSVRDNIIFNRSDVTEDDVVQSSILVELHSSVMELPRGYDTPAFGAGGGLSGSQQHRLLLARALVRRPSLLVIDDVIGWLDAGSERRILDRLKSAGCLTIVMSQRLTAARYADLVLVLRDGRLIESGVHDQLLSAAGLYARLAIEQGITTDVQSVRVSRARGGIRYVEGG